MLELRRDALAGRGYSLLRDGEPIGALRRRGLWRPRYEFDSGPRHWMVRFHVNKRAGEPTDRGARRRGCF